MASPVKYQHEFSEMRLKRELPSTLSTNTFGSNIPSTNEDVKGGGKSEEEERPRRRIEEGHIPITAEFLRTNLSDCRYHGQKLLFLFTTYMCKRIEIEREKRRNIR